MSQHYFYTKYNSEDIVVMVGWDRPLQGYFMIIDNPNLESEEPFWSNLINHNPAHPKTLDSFLDVLRDLKITIPQQMVDEILTDRKENLGNKQIIHELKNGIYKRTEENS